jgi:hypothetical protein
VPHFTYCKLTCPTGSERGTCPCTGAGDCKLTKKEQAQLFTLGRSILGGWDAAIQTRLRLNDAQYSILLGLTEDPKPNHQLYDMEPCSVCTVSVRGFKLGSCINGFGGDKYEDLNDFMVCNVCRRLQLDDVPPPTFLSFPDVSGA